MIPVIPYRAAFRIFFKGGGGGGQNSHSGIPGEANSICQSHTINLKGGRMPLPAPPPPPKCSPAILRLGWSRLINCAHQLNVACVARAHRAAGRKKENVYMVYSNHLLSLCNACQLGVLFLAYSSENYYPLLHNSNNWLCYSQIALVVYHHDSFKDTTTHCHQQHFLYQLKDTYRIRVRIMTTSIKINLLNYYQIEVCLWLIALILSNTHGYHVCIKSSY